MTYRTVSVSVAVAVVALTAIDAFIVYKLQEPGRFIGHVVLRLFCFGIASLAAGLAAQRYHWWDEYVGRAWTLLFILYALITVREAINRLAPEAGAAGEALVIAGNVAAVGAFWLFGRVLHSAGLEFYGSRMLKIGVFLVAVAIACALVLPTIISSLTDAMPGIRRASSLASAAADMITFILVAPLLLTVWSFRGGQLSWIYGFLALSTIGWMINQAANDLLPAPIIRDGQMFGFILACASVTAAGYSQIASSRRGAAHA